jgi:RNA polymerase sigma-70 factor (ECF subfamily)
MHEFPAAVTDRASDSSSEPIDFDEIYRLYSIRVFRYCLGQVRNIALAEDLGADTFAAAYVAYGKKPPGPEAIAPWLFRIARNLIIDHNRRERRRGRIDGLLGRSRPRPQTVEEIAATSERLAEVVRLMGQMRERDRMLLGLRLAAGLSNHDTAEILGMGEAAATQAYNRALERFRKLSERSP